MTLPLNSRLVMTARARRFMGIYGRARQFRAAIPKIEAAAASIATTTSRSTFTRQLNRRGRPVAPPRFRRPSTGGQFDSLIRWTASNNNISFDLALIERVAPYFLIQEIGTGKSARILNPPGSVSVRAQTGRAISANLYWAPGPGANAVGARTGASGDQLYFAKELNAATLSAVPRRKKRIRREIHGKHYLQAGGRAGYLELRKGLTDEAKRIFK